MNTSRHSRFLNRLFQQAKGALNHLYARIVHEPLPCRPDCSRVPVHDQQTPAIIQALQDGTAVPTAAERGIDIIAIRSDSQTLKYRLQQNRPVEITGRHYEFMRQRAAAMTAPAGQVRACVNPVRTLAL